jgi:hypothetical protein
LMFAAAGIVASEWPTVYATILISQLYIFTTTSLSIVNYSNIRSASGGIALGVLIGLSVIAASPARGVPRQLLSLLQSGLSREATTAYIRRHFRELRVIGAVAASMPFAAYFVDHISLSIAAPAVSTAKPPKPSGAVPASSRILRDLPQTPPAGSRRTLPIARILKLSRLNIPAVVSLDVIEVAGSQHSVGLSPRTATFQVKGDESINLHGWAFDPRTREPAAGVAIRISGRDFPASYGSIRPDVANAYSTPDLDAVGFLASLNAQDLRRGLNVVSVVVVSSDQASYYLNATHLRLDKKEQ